MMSAYIQQTVCHLVLYKACSLHFSKNTQNKACAIYVQTQHKRRRFLFWVDALRQSGNPMQVPTIQQMSMCLVFDEHVTLEQVKFCQKGSPKQPRVAIRRLPRVQGFRPWHHMLDTASLLLEAGQQHVCAAASTAHGTLDCSHHHTAQCHCPAPITMCSQHHSSAYCAS